MTSLDTTIFNTDTRSLTAFIPDRQLLPNSLQVMARVEPFGEWSNKDHVDSYHFMQRIADAWKNNHLTDQYLIYGKVNSSSFRWEMVPYEKCRTFIGRIVQQLQVLWRIVFGGIKIPEKAKQNKVLMYRDMLDDSSPGLERSSAASKAEDSFCKDDTIERQWVIKGKKVNVLFNHAPIGFGGERLHFLVVPKEHRETFTEVTEEEYCESMELTRSLVNHFSERRENIENVYLMNKTGRDAGQTVKHWHLHVIFSTNKSQDLWGKITVIKNILFGSSPMKKDQLATTVGRLRVELVKLSE